MTGATLGWFQDVAGMAGFRRLHGTPDRDTNATGPHHAFIHAMLGDFSTLWPGVGELLKGSSGDDLGGQVASVAGVSHNIPFGNLTVM